MTEESKTAEGELPNEEARTRAYEEALLHRYNNHLYLTRADLAEARRIIKARKSA